MKKNILYAIIAILVVAVGYYLIAPAFIVEEVNEELPTVQNTQPLIQPEPTVVEDALDAMTDVEKEEFDNAVEDAQENEKVMEEAMPEGPIIVSEGEFKPRAHEVEGVAKLVDINGQKILRFEDFNTINGPNLHVYLASDVSDKDFIDLGELKGTRGNFNYELDDSIDTDKYNKVLVWCVPFRVLFSYADVS